MTTRGRATATLFATAALMNAAMAAASPVSTIVAADRLGAAWGGVPNTAGIVGTGIGAIVLTRATNRWGWRASLALGYVAATVGGALAIPAVAGSDITILSIGMLLLGLGNAGALLSRYAAADLYPLQRRGFAIGTVVWAGAGAASGDRAQPAPPPRCPRYRFASRSRCSRASLCATWYGPRRPGRRWPSWPPDRWSWSRS